MSGAMLAGGEAFKPQLNRTAGVPPSKMGHGGSQHPRLALSHSPQSGCSSAWDFIRPDTPRRCHANVSKDEIIEEIYVVRLIAVRQKTGFSFSFSLSLSLSRACRKMPYKYAILATRSQPVSCPATARILMIHLPGIQRFLEGSSSG